MLKRHRFPLPISPTIVVKRTKRQQRFRQIFVVGLDLVGFGGQRHEISLPPFLFSRSLDFASIFSFALVPLLSLLLVFFLLLVLSAVVFSS